MRAPCPVLLRLWEQEACERLRDAFDEAFGGVPDGVAVQSMVVRAPPGPALVELADQDDDLLVVEKSAWVLTVPTDGGETNTLVDRLGDYLRRTGRGRHATRTSPRQSDRTTS